MELGFISGLPSVWTQPTIVDCFKEFFTNPSFLPWKALPLLATWGLWLACNAILFENKYWPPFKITQQAYALTVVQSGDSTQKAWTTHFTNSRSNKNRGPSLMGPASDLRKIVD